VSWGRNRSTHLEPADDDVQLLVGQRLHVRRLIRQRRNNEALDDGEDLLPDLAADHRKGCRVSPATAHRARIGVVEGALEQSERLLKVLEEQIDRLFDLGVGQTGRLARGGRRDGGDRLVLAHGRDLGQIAAAAAAEEGAEAIELHLAPLVAEPDVLELAPEDVHLEVEAVAAALDERLEDRRRKELADERRHLPVSQSHEWTARTLSTMIRTMSLSVRLSERKARPK